MEANVNLRAPEPADVDALYALENAPDIWRVSWGEAPVSRQMIWAYIDAYTADIFRDRQLRFIIDIDGAAVGAIDLSDFDPINRRAIVGVAVKPEERGKGIASAALQQLIDYSSKQLGIHQLAALVPRDNRASISLFRKFGFKTAGCLRSWLRRGKSYEDVFVMQLLF